MGDLHDAGFPYQGFFIVAIGLNKSPTVVRSLQADKNCKEGQNHKAYQSCKKSHIYRQYIYISDKLQIFAWYFLSVMAPGPSMAPALGGLCLYTTPLSLHNTSVSTQHTQELRYFPQKKWKYLDFGEGTNCSDCKGSLPKKNH